MMNLHLPGGGLNRGRVWRSQAWVSASGKASKPWLGTLVSGSSESDRAGRTPNGGNCSCPWAAGNDLPYIQQTLISDPVYLSLSEFKLPSPTSPTSGDQQQQWRSMTSSATTSDDVKQHNSSSEVSGSLEEDEINRCIGVLDDILDLYDADDFDDAELYRSTEPVSDASSSHLLPLKSCARTAVRNLEIRKSMSTVRPEITQRTSDSMEEPSLDRISNKELYARRKQALQLPPSTVSSSDSAVSLQCNEQSTDGEYELFFPAPNIQDNRSNPDSGYLANTDVDSITSADLSVGGSKRSARSHGSSGLTSLRSCRWLSPGATEGVAEKTSGMSAAAAQDDDDNAAPSSGSTLTNASSSHSSSLTAADTNDATLGFNVAGLSAPAAVRSIYDELNDTDEDGTIRRREDERPTSSTSAIPPSSPPLASPPNLTSTPTSYFYDEELTEFPLPPPAVGSLGSSSTLPDAATPKKLPPPPPPVKPSSVGAFSSEVEQFPVFPPPPPFIAPPEDSVSPSVTVRPVQLGLPPPPPLMSTSGGTWGSEVDEFSVFPPPPPMMLPTVDAVSPSSDVPVTQKKLPPPPPPKKPSKTTNDSAMSPDIGTFSFRTSTSSTTSSRHSRTRNSLPPTPPAPPPSVPATNPPPPPPRSLATVDFPPPPTFQTLPVPSNTAERSSASSVPAPPPPCLPLPPQDEFNADDDFDAYSTIADVLGHTDTPAGGLAAALKGVRLRTVTDAEKSSPFAGPTQKDALSALVDQLHGGFQLRPTAMGHRIRGVDSTSVEDGADSTVQPIPEADDEEYVNFNELPQPRASVKPLPPVPVKKSAPHRNPAPFNSQAEPTDHIDATQVPGYQVIPPDCPQWKRALIEKKNAALLAEAQREYEAKRQEEERWKDVPEWKRNLIAKKQWRSST